MNSLVFLPSYKALNRIMMTSAYLSILVQRHVIFNIPIEFPLDYCLIECNELRKNEKNNNNMKRCKIYLNSHRQLCSPLVFRKIKTLHHFLYTGEERKIFATIS